MTLHCQKIALLLGCVLLGLAFSFFGAQPLVSGEVSDQAVNARITLLRQNLLRAQKDDGAWLYPGYPVGGTALVLLALRTAGLPADHPAIRRGTEYIVKRTDQKVYSEGLVPCALELINPKKNSGRIRQATAFLLSAQNKNGSWSYTAKNRGGAFDNSNTQFAILGLAAAERCGLKIPPRVRTRAVAHWRKNQSRDGGWCYKGPGSSYLAMTCAGIASLHLLGVPLEKNGKKCGNYVYDRTLSKALGCLTRQLGGRRLGTDANRHNHYALYALERVGMLMDIKVIGNLDWYRAGASYLLHQPPSDNLANNALELLFLAKGAAPIAIAKWQWSGDWNNDHRDVKNWVEGVGKQLDRKLDWIPAKLNSLKSPAAKASMIFVNGHQVFHATAEELNFLRAFLEAGGTVVAEACCGRRTFVDSFRKVITARLFPQTNLRFVPMNTEHQVCNGVYKLRPAEVGGLILKAGCRKRRLVLLTRDISCALNGEPVEKKELNRARKVATNLLLWALKAKSADMKLDDVELASVSVDTEELTADQIRRRNARSSVHFHQPFGRLKHRGDWMADIKFFTHLDKMLAARKGLPRFDGEVYVSLKTDDLFQTAVVFMNGHEAPALTEEERVNLRTYLQNGGFLFASSCCASSKFNVGFLTMLLMTLPNDKIEEIPSDDAIWRQPFANNRQTVHGTTAYQQKYGNRWGPLFGIRREGRWIVVYSPVDLCCAIEGDLDDDIIGYRKEEAFRLVGNILHYAISP